jgi:uncharacterized membrane protein YphA (DoxX/SURF4 family)
MAEASGARNIVTWVLSALLAAVYLLTGGMKLAGTEEVASNFGKFGYPLWFSYLVGLGEIGGALLLFASQVASYAAGFLILIMLGAAFSHLRVGESPAIPLVMAALLAVVAWLRRPAAT